MKDGIRVLIGVADVDSAVPEGTPIDRHAAREATSVYAAVRTFPMLPEAAFHRHDVTQREPGPRRRWWTESVVDGDGDVGGHSVYRAMVRNRAQLAYSGVGAWLEGKAAAPPKLAASADLQVQLKLQDQAATALRDARFRLGALSFDRVEPMPIFSNGDVKEIQARQSNRAAHLIEDFMIAANEVMARTLRDAGVSSIRRIVKQPERWPRMVIWPASMATSCRPNPIPARSTHSCCAASRPIRCTTPTCRWRCSS